MAGKNDMGSNQSVGDGTTNEVVSALLDGETAHLSEKVLRAAVEDEQSRASWARYQLIGEAVRESSHLDQQALASSTFAEKVRSQIEAEPTVLAPKSSRERQAPRYLQPIAGLAIAASVAGMAVIGIQQMSPSEGEAVQPLSVANLDAAEQVLAASAASDSAETPELEIDLEEHKRRLNSYLVNFNEQRAGLGMPGVNPYVRIIDFESEK